MPYLGDQILGTMSILAKIGGYQFGPANRIHPGLGHHNRRACVLNICSSIATQCTRVLPLFYEETMAANGTYQTKLAKELDHLPKRKNQSTSTYTTKYEYLHNQVRVPTQPRAGTSKELTPLYMESIKHVGGSNR